MPMDYIKKQKRAIAAIKYYLRVENNPKWNDEYILTNYDLAVECIIENADRINDLKGNIPGVSQITEGSSSISIRKGHEAWAITDDIKTLLPRPFNNYKVW